jgi:tetratricopeptide (TPR) repeat protein
MTLQLILLQFAGASRSAERAVAQARRSGDVRGEIESLYFFAVAAAVGPTPVADGLARSEELLAGAPGPHATASIETGLAALRAMAGDLDEARATIRTARATMHELGLALHADAASFVETQVERHAGDLEAAERVLREADASLAALGDVAYRSQGVAVLAGVLADLGRLDEALAAAEQASRMDVVPMARAYWRAGRSRALARLGAQDEAAALAREAAVLLADTDALHVRAELLESLAEVVGGAEGDEALAEALDLYEQKGCLVCAARLRERAGPLEKEARAARGTT